MDGGAWWAAVCGVAESDTTEQFHFQFSLSCLGEGNGNPLQCSCLENPRNGGVWWAAEYGVAQSQTRLKWLNSSSRIQSCIRSRWCQCHITLSRLCLWNGSTMGTVGRMCISRKGEWVRSFLLPRSSLWVNQQLCSLDELLQQLKLKIFSFFSYLVCFCSFYALLRL